MAHVEKKRIKGKEYYYLKESKRVDGKVKTRTLVYLGKKKPTEEDIEKAKQQFQVSSEQFLSKEQLNKLEEIKKDFKKRLKDTTDLVTEKMWADFIANYTFNTNAIEGNTINLRETAMLLYEGIAPSGKDMREIYDHQNSKAAFEYILAKKPPVNNKTIIGLHEMLMKNIDKRVRAYRTHDVRVLGATFKSSPAKYVLIDMSKTAGFGASRKAPLFDMRLLIKWYNRNKRKLHPLILATMFHHKFEKIHPFYDGNGRTGRLLLNLILRGASYPPLLIKKDKRVEYCNILSSADKSGIGEMDPACYERLINYCYSKLIKTYEDIFKKWG